MNWQDITPTNFIEEEIIKDLQSGKADQVITRFPPEPSGYWYLGHARAIMTNFEIAQKFGGYTILRMDDTNPLKEEEGFAKSYAEELAWLGYTPKKTVYASEAYFDKTYEYAEAVIQKGLAYVCDLSAEEVSKMRGTLTESGTDSPYRNRSIEENLLLFREMRAGKYADGSRTLRAKIDMKSPNMNMRDPVIYRIMRAHHYRTGDKWCIYPMYDFAHPLQDYIEGTTFSLCSLEYEDHRPLYNWVLDAVGVGSAKNRPRQIEFGKFQIEGAMTGKRHIKALVGSGNLLGWDDPRLLTLVAMRRRGYTAAGVKEFLRRVGIKKSEGLVEFTALEACIREDLNQVAPRAMAVLDPLKVVLTNLQATEECEVENLPGGAEKHKMLLTKEIYIEREDFSDNPPPKYNRLVAGGMVRLKGAYIIKCNDVIRDEANHIISLACEIISGTKSGQDNSGVKVKGTIHFVSATENIKIKIRTFTQLLRPEFKNIAKELNEGRTAESMLAAESLFESEAFGEKWLQDAQVGAPYQFMRKGYFCKDKDSTEEMPVFNLTVSLKESFKE